MRKLAVVLGLLLFFFAAANAAGQEVSGEPNSSLQIPEPTSPQIISLTANPHSGTAPLTVQFITIISGEEPFSYAWDFNSDGITDSTNQNPSMLFETAGETIVQLTVTNNNDESTTKTISITVLQYESKLNMVSFFPTEIQLGENQITFLLENTGKETIKDISAKIIGDSIQHLSSTTIGRLKPSDQDSLTVKINILKAGTLEAKVKIDEKMFPITLQVAGQRDKAELQQTLTELKQRLQEQENIYSEKKAQNYLVSEIFESIKSLKKQLQDAQRDLLTNELDSAAVALDLTGPSINDIARDLGEVKKQKQTILVWLKDNALALTTIIAGLGTVSTFIVKASLRAKKLGEEVRDKAKKLGEDVKERIVKKQSANKVHTDNSLPSESASIYSEQVSDNTEKKD